MKSFIIRAMVTLTLLLCSQSASADRQTRYVPGTGTYGVSTEKYQCPRCGKVLHKGSGHACTVETPDASPSRSSRSSYDADAGAADAMISSNPDLLINKSYVRDTDPLVSMSENDGTPESNDNDEEDDDWEAYLGLAALAAFVYWIMKR